MLTANLCKALKVVKCIQCIGIRPQCCQRRCPWLGGLSIYVWDHELSMDPSPKKAKGIYWKIASRLVEIDPWGETLSSLICFRRPKLSPQPTAKLWYADVSLWQYWCHPSFGPPAAPQPPGIWSTSLSPQMITWASVYFRFYKVMYRLMLSLNRYIAQNRCIYIYKYHIKNTLHTILL